MTIKEAQQIVDDWIQEYGVRYFSELTNMAILTEEVGEVARIISRQYGDQSFKASDKEKELADELADVLFVVICLANQTGIDLEALMSVREIAASEMPGEHLYGALSRAGAPRQINWYAKQTTG